MELPRSSARRRRRFAGWLLLAGVLGLLAWAGWRAYDERAAVREAQAAGSTWEVRTPFRVIRADWHQAFRQSTWISYRKLNLGGYADLARFAPLLRRLRPTIMYAHCRDTDLDALRGLTSLQLLSLYDSPALQNVDGLRGLTGLKILNLRACPALQNVDALRGITGLQELYLEGCTGLAPAGLRELAAALPKTTIAFPNGAWTPPP